MRLLGLNMAEDEGFFERARPIVIYLCQITLRRLFPWHGYLT